MFTALKYGVIGLCAILTSFAFQLLAKEHRQESPRPAVLRSIWIFMSFSLLTMIMGLLSQLPSFRPLAAGESTGALSSQFDGSYFNGDWDIQGKDVAFGTFHPRYLYKGKLHARVDGNNLVLEGDLQTIWDSNVPHVGDDFRPPNGNPVLATARFIARGPIRNNQVASVYSLERKGVEGFGTLFIEFDSAGHGNGYIFDRITRTLTDEGDIARADMRLSRLN